MIVYEYCLMQKPDKEEEAGKRCVFFSQNKGLLLSMVKQTKCKFIDTVFVCVYDVNDEGVLSKAGLEHEAQAMQTKEFLKLTNGVLLGAEIYNKKYPRCRGYAEVIAVFPDGKDYKYYYFGTKGCVLDACDWEIAGRGEEPVSLLTAWKRLDAIEQQRILNTCGIRGWAIENNYQLPSDFTYDEYCDCIEYTRGDRKPSIQSYHSVYVAVMDHTVIFGIYHSFITGSVDVQVTGEYGGKPNKEFDEEFKTCIIDRLQDAEEDFD